MQIAFHFAQLLAPAAICHIPLYVNLAKKCEFSRHLWVGVYTLQTEMESGGGFVSVTNSQLESPGEMGEAVY